MPGVYRSPGVYVEEISTFPPSVAEVSTAVPAFLGYSETGNPMTPTRIESLGEYQQAFGGPPPVVTSVAVANDGTYQPTLTPDANIPLLYYSLRLYFDNGGGPCYIVSLGGYGDAVALDPFSSALDALRKEDEPTLIVMPDATRLGAADFSSACAAALTHCGTMRDRFAVLDVKRGQAAKDFRQFSSDSLAYGAAYTPFLDTSLAYTYDENKVTVSLQAGPVTFSGNMGGLTVNCKATADKAPSVVITGGDAIVFVIDATPKLTVTAPATATAKQVSDAWAAWKQVGGNNTNGFDITPGDATVVTAKTAPLTTPPTLPPTLGSFKNTDTGMYNQMKATLATLRATLPPSGAIAGIYASVDRDRGVWKAPANVAVASVLGLDQTFTNDDLDGLNIDPTSGKSINVIRSFAGRGILVWGARTLAGNDNEWRYVSVRRLFIMIEESTLKASAFAVFEPNTAETWLKVKAMVESFLYGLWEQGALAGTKPADAYCVNVGLGTTMTAQDILEGRMIVKIGIAAVRPAEFIILQFSQTMQQS